MFSILMQQKCYVCGDLTTHASRLCERCRNESEQICGETCSICGIPIISEKSVCLRCRTMNYSFDRNISIFVYANMARDIFFQYKFRKHREIGLWFCELIAGRIKNDFHGYILVPSPARYFKKVKKGWDQVEYLVNVLSKHYSIRSRSLLKRAAGKDQKKLDLEGRRKNLRGNIIFRKNKGNISGEKILFIDDVFTTGATADECARVLKDNGAAEVAVLTIAID